MKHMAAVMVVVVQCYCSREADDMAAEMEVCTDDHCYKAFQVDEEGNSDAAIAQLDPMEDWQPFGLVILVSVLVPVLVILSNDTKAVAVAVWNTLLACVAEVTVMVLVVVLLLPLYHVGMDLKKLEGG